MKCHSRFKCKVCNKRHHRLLHQDLRDREITTTTTAQVAVTSQVLLATASINVIGRNGTVYLLRALIDQGSQRSFITEEAAQRLNLPMDNAKVAVCGIGASSVNTTRGKVKLQIPEKWSERILTTNALVLQKLKNQLPTLSLHKIKHNELADPSYNIPGKIDILLGADIYGHILMNGIIKNANGPTAQRTTLGWIISGPTNTDLPSSLITTHVGTDDYLDETIKKFWEIEEIRSPIPKTDAEIQTENHYEKTHSRDHTGRYMVKLPLINTSTRTCLAPSRNSAITRLRQVEARLAKNPLLRQEYNKFMDEYLLLGHMQKVPSAEVFKRDTYYVPHHAVIKESSTTTKVRVVFDASNKTASGKSLNDLLLTGPTLQDNIGTILLRWRKHRIVITGDIEKMYRQIKIHPDDANLQRIVWRKSPTDPIQDFELTTVTYGTQAPHTWL